ncbi:response regulator [Aquimarina sp. 2201CG14-23]|uniref:response regulator n=1 Tax=Aquimarina mycalae TaxID=3040073 RepID=UPI002477D2F7|nr:response regulator [Aquimarina sp. 2201CG14-23]MDH7447082.1 response regulator [Aquimarina sp. 2201CG14-23]
MKKKLSLQNMILVFMLLYCLGSFAYQTKEIDNGIATITQSTDCNKNSYDVFFKRKTSKEITQLRKHFNVSTQNIAKANISNLLAEAYHKLKKPDSANYFAHTSLRFIQNEEKSDLKEKIHIQSLIRLGIANHQLNNTNISISYLKDAEDMIDISKNKKCLLKSRQIIAYEQSRNYVTQANFEEAINTYTSFQKFIETNGFSDFNIHPILLIRVSENYYELKQLDLSLSFALDGWNASLNHGNDFNIGRAGNVMARILMHKNKIDEVPYYLEKALKNAVKSGHKAIIATTYKNLSLLEKKRSDQEKRLHYAKLAYTFALQDVQSTHELFHTGMLYAETLNELNQPENALKVFNNVVPLIHVFEHNIFDEKTIKLESEILRAKIDANREQNMLEQRVSRQKDWLITILSCLFLMMIILVISLYYGLKRRRKLNQLLSQQKEELNELNNSKSRLFTNISHELRTPLTLISGPATQILQEHNDFLPVGAREKIQIIQKNANSLKTLVDDILDLSRLEANKSVLNNHMVDISKTFKKSVHSFSFLSEQKAINFSYDFNDLHKYLIAIDAFKIEKIINNLLSNAFKYTPQKGKINFITSLNDSNLQILINDTGTGISNKDLPHIFDRYFQSNDPLKPPKGGSGIGLSLVKELVDLMQGEINIESQLEKGTTITVKIPVLENSIKKVEQSNIKPDDANVSRDHLISKDIEINKKYTVLVVEDHPDMQNYIVSILQKQYQIVRANNGSEALSLLQQNKIDLIISDVMMPVMDGYSLLKYIKQDTSYYDIPFIMLTALLGKEKKLKALTIGADDYLSKPFNASELLARTYNLIYRYQERKKLKEKIIHPVKELSETTNQKADNYSDRIIDKNFSKQNKSDIDLIKKAAEIIEKNLESSEFKLSNLTQELNLGERQLRRKIKMVTGLGPKKFQQEIILTKARYLLENKTYENVKAVALSVGFTHVTRFSRLYETRYGKKPIDYFDT